MSTGLSLHVVAAGSIQFLAGIPSFRWQSGDFVNAVIDNGVGDVSIDFVPGNGIDESACAIIVTARNLQAAGRGDSIGVQHVTDERKNFTIVQQAAPAASVRADVDFSFIVVRLPGK